LRERFEQGEIDIDPYDDKLAAQLGSIKWGIDFPRPDQDRIEGRQAQAWSSVNQTQPTLQP
jgi:hypothetical protein